MTFRKIKASAVILFFVGGACIPSLFHLSDYAYFPFVRLSMYSNGWDIPGKVRIFQLYGTAKRPQGGPTRYIPLGYYQSLFAPLRQYDIVRGLVRSMTADPSLATAKLAMSQLLEKYRSRRRSERLDWPEITSLRLYELDMAEVRYAKVRSPSDTHRLLIEVQ